MEYKNYDQAKNVDDFSVLKEFHDHLLARRFIVIALLKTFSYVGDVSYVFQGVPENGQIKSTVSMYDAKNKPTQLGNFTMSKAE